jgi:hypothetical protein
VRQEPPPVAKQPTTCRETGDHLSQNSPPPVAPVRHSFEEKTLKQAFDFSLCENQPQKQERAPFFPNQKPKQEQPQHLPGEEEKQRPEPKPWQPPTEDEYVRALGASYPGSQVPIGPLPLSLETAVVNAVRRCGGQTIMDRLQSFRWAYFSWSAEQRERIPTPEQWFDENSLKDPTGWAEHLEAKGL